MLQEIITSTQKCIRSYILTQSAYTSTGSTKTTGSMAKQWSIILITLTDMKAEVGMKFYDAYSGTHEVVEICSKHKGFYHVYYDGKRHVRGFMYDVAFERLTKANAIYVL